MKRFFVLILLAFALLNMAFFVSAEEAVPYVNAGALCQMWVEAGIPDYISAVWSTDGVRSHLTVSIVVGHEEMADILYSQIQDPDTLTVVYQQYSWNSLIDIQKTIEPYMEQGYGFVGLGVDLYENTVVLEVHTDYQENAQSQALVETLRSEYGSCLTVRYVDHYPQLTYTPEPADQDVFWRPRQAWDKSLLFVLLGAALLLIAASGLMLRRQQDRITVLSQGAAVVSIKRRRVSCRDVKSLLNNGWPDFPDSLDGRLEASITAGMPPANTD